MYFVFVSNCLWFCLGNSIIEHILSYKVIGNRPSSYFQTQPWAFGIMTHYKLLYLSEKKNESKISSIAYIFRNSTYSSFFVPACFAGCDTWRVACNALTSLSTGVERAFMIFLGSELFLFCYLPS